MNFEFIKFLFLSVFKKKATWIVGLFYVFLNSLFLIIIPAIIHENPLIIWSNTMLWSQIYLIFVAALFSGIEAVNIFRDSNEDGTELIIISKPISRAKIIASKFFVFFVLSLMVTVATMLIIPFMYLLPEMQTEYIGSLELSILVTNTIIFLLFGGIAILFSLRFGKIATMVSTIAVATFFSIYSVVVPLVFTTPLTAMVTQKNTFPSTYSFLTYSGENKNAVNFSTSIPIESSATMRQMYAECENNDSYVIAQSFNMCSQMTLLYNSFDLKEYSYKQAEAVFASNSWYNYDLTQDVYQPFDSTEYKPDDSVFGNGSLPVVFPSFKLEQEDQIVPAVYMIADSNDMLTQPDNELAFIYDDNNNKVRLKYDDLWPSSDEIETYNEMYEEILGEVLVDTTTKTPSWAGEQFYETILYNCIHARIVDLNISNMYDFNLATLKLKFYTFFQISSQWWGAIDSNLSWEQNWINIQENEIYIKANFIFNTWILEVEDYGFVSLDEPTRKLDKYKNYIDFYPLSSWENYMYNFYYYSLEPWISYETVGIAWGSIGVVMYFIAVIVYSREDIK